jgi:hypothetical protein
MISLYYSTRNGAYLPEFDGGMRPSDFGVPGSNGWCPIAW